MDEEAGDAAVLLTWALQIQILEFMRRGDKTAVVPSQGEILSRWEAASFSP